MRNALGYKRNNDLVTLNAQWFKAVNGLLKLSHFRS